MLKSLHIQDVGPASRLDLELGERLSVLTGDNGLGKSFVLEVAWWALTGAWVGRPVLPQRGKEESARLSGEVHGQDFASHFDRIVQQWGDPYQGDGTIGQHRLPQSNVTIPDWLSGQDPVLYGRPDGSFSVSDPARFRSSTRRSDGGFLRTAVGTHCFHFNTDTLWNGLEEDGKTVCNGLIQDWVTWQLEAQNDATHPFHLLRTTIEKLSHPEEPMTPGKPVRLYLDDVRKIPTIDLPYENIPVVHVSSGMKRILGLAYLVTWMWTEHVQACSMIGRKPAERVVVLFEEPETHLHPKWQRHIVPALLSVLGGLSAAMRPQLILTTHAPLVLASMEPSFDPLTDQLFHFALEGKDVILQNPTWQKHGDSAGWLASDVFDLSRGGYSRDAEQAINAAYDFLAGKTAELPEGLRTADEINKQLEGLLGPEDPFWPRWRFRPGSAK